MVRGIDVSSFQSLATVERYAALPFVRFGFVKATEGRGYTNPVLAEQVAIFHRHGKPCGLYHFLRSDEGAPAQAQHFMTRCRPYAGSAVLIVDHETDETGHVPADNLVRDFVEHVHDAGYNIGRYASAYLFAQGVGADFRWVAAWGVRPPHLKWRLWQQSGTSKIDWDVFNGDEAALLKWWKRTAYHRTAL